MNRRETYLKSLGYTKPFSYWLKLFGYRLFVYLPENDLVVHYYEPVYLPLRLGVIDVFRFDYPLPLWESYQDLGAESFINFDHHIKKDNFTFDPNKKTISSLLEECSNTTKEEAIKIISYAIKEVGMTRQIVRLMND